MPATNLWPDFKIDPKPRGIRQVLEEAGSGLEDKTKGIVGFRVLPLDRSDNPALPFRFRCDLYVEKLDYNYPLLYVSSAATGFPAEVSTYSGGIKVDDESALLAALETIFHSGRTVAIVENLISMATE
ncbi:MAG: hypothetical protein J0I06_11685 [Planctomycetes bacterium]|nr:hypothetical protein [Planctomycetota bacterium]